MKSVKQKAELYGPNWETVMAALMDLWLNGYLVYFDGKRIIAAYVA